MKKNSILFLTSILFSLLIAEIGLRLSPYKFKRSEFSHFAIMQITPNFLFIYDKDLGWKLGNAGVYKVGVKSFPYYKITVDSLGNRTTGYNSKYAKPQIHLYGCSFTFGQSVNDTLSYPFQLQKKMPAFEIRNKGINGYSLLQMFLALKKDVEKGQVPKVAVFNYANFHNERSPLGKNWIRGRNFNLKFQEKNKYRQNNFNYPFAIIDKNGNLCVKYMSNEHWPQDFWLRDKLYLMDLLNSVFDKIWDKANESYLEEISFRLTSEIKKYCLKHCIKLIFTGMDKKSEVFLGKIAINGIDTLFFNVNIKDPNMNCQPTDSNHPSPKAHKIYAQKLFDFLVLHKVNL